jgi:uncharacterized protein
MRLDDMQEGGNIEDRRGDGYSGGGGGGFGLPVGGGGLGIGTIIVIGLLAWAFGIDPRLLLGGAEILNGGGSPSVQGPPPSTRHGGAPKDEMGRFVSKVLNSTDQEWKKVFAADGKSYRPPTLVLYRGMTRAACGGAAQSAMGPFYCPADQKVYLDTSFFDQIATRFRGCEGGKACQFPAAYVIAHEVGHHVQNLLGILPKVQSMQRGVDRAQANHLQVQVELQADCFAGIWANRENQRQKERGRPPFIDQSDVDAALQTAAAIGDDTLQKKATGRVVPDAFTHGSSEQRQRWFTTGLKQGTVGACDTFKAARL